MATVSAGRVTGWALDSDAPFARVPLEVIVDGVAVAWGIADQRRPDLEMTGQGDGACAFDVSFDPPPSARPAIGRMIEVRRATDGTQLPGSPVLLSAPRIGGSLADAVRAACGPGAAGHAAVAGTLLRGIDAAVLAAAHRAPSPLEISR